MRLVQWSLIVILSASVASAAPERDPEPPQDLGTMIDGLFVAYDKGERPGYAIGVVSQGKLVFSGGYGMADIEGKVPITADTIIQHSLAFQAIHRRCDCARDHC